MWKNMAQGRRPVMTIWYGAEKLLATCMYDKQGSNTHSEHLMPIAFPWHNWLCKIASVSPYTYITCLVLMFFWRFADRAPQYNLSNWPISCTNSCFIISLLYVTTCFEHYVFIIRRSKLYYTASGIITLVGGRPVQTPLHVLTSWWWAHSARNM